MHRQYVRFIPRRMWMALAVATVVLYPFLFVFQGLDFTDTGFAASNYQMIFSHPESISYWSFNYWLTDIIGGLWFKGFGPWGLLGLRIAAAICVVLTSFLVYLTVRQHVRHWIIWLGLLTGEAIIERMYWLNYDNLTALFYVLTACILLFGISQKKRNAYVLFLVAGICLGLTAFLRVTNVVDLSLVLVLPASVGLLEKRWRFALLAVLVALVGAFSVSLLLIAYMKATAQYSLFLNNIRTLFSIAGGHSNTHSGSYLLANWKADEWNAVRTSGWTFVLLIASMFLRRLPGQFTGFILLITLFILGIVWLWPVFFIRYDFVAGLTGVLYALLVIGIFRYARTNPILAVISLMAFIILLVEPTGSDLGILVATYGMYLAIPVAGQVIHDIVDVWHVSKNPIGANNSMSLGPIAAGLVMMVVLSVGMYTGYHYTYRDTSNRILMRFTVDNPKLRGIYTTYDRATVVQQLLNALARYVHSGDVLFAYEETSLVYYLTDTVPYLGTSWPELYDPGQLKSVLQLKSSEGGPWPVVVRAKGATADFNWPNVHTLRLDYRHNHDRVLVGRFLQQHGYHVVWENQFFQILEPAHDTSKRG